MGYMGNFFQYTKSHIPSLEGEQKGLLTGGHSSKE